MYYKVYRFLLLIVHNNKIVDCSVLLHVYAYMYIIHVCICATVSTKDCSCDLRTRIGSDGIAPFGFLCLAFKPQQLGMIYIHGVETPHDSRELCISV